MSRKGAVVLRFDAEAYESPQLLAQAMLARAAGALTSTVAKAAHAAGRFFSALRPEVSIRLDTPGGVEAMHAAILEDKRSQWQRMQRLGPPALVKRYTVFLTVALYALAIVILPSSLVPTRHQLRVPSFLAVLAATAVVPFAIAMPLGLRSWNRAARAWAELDESSWAA
jgi:hypothetical protein